MNIYVLNKSGLVFLFNTHLCIVKFKDDIIFRLRFDPFIATLRFGKTLDRSFNDSIFKLNKENVETNCYRFQC